MYLGQAVSNETIKRDMADVVQYQTKPRAG